VLLSTATLTEIGAYYIPWIDNLLDSIATPAVMISGTAIPATVMPEMNEGMKWALTAIAGGSSAGLIQTGTVLIRSLSTATSGGVANPVVSTTEAGSSLLTSILAISLFFIFIWIIGKLIKKMSGRKAEQAT
jgi:hypothetical protein